MDTTIEPIIFKCKETLGYLDNLEKEIKQSKGADADLLLEYPVVYMHVWQNKTDLSNKQYHVYIGEGDDVVRRQAEHWRDAKDPSKWQYRMANDVDVNKQVVVPTLYVIGHKYFQKSLTLDIENKLINFCRAMPTAIVENERLNPQGKYNGDEVFGSIFGYIWKYLKNDNPELFLSETKIMKSAIYRASPNHKLSGDQKTAKNCIVSKVFDALINQKKHQLVMVEGEAGTGKTVLASSTFYDLLRKVDDSECVSDSDIRAFLLVNHEEQLGVYRDMAKQMGYKDEIVMNPTRFIRKHEPNGSVDIAFVDEAHLLWTQKKQSYNMGNKQLKDIMDRAKVTVIMFDEYQALRKEQFIEPEYINEIRDLSKNQGNHIPLVNQFRMGCDENTMAWIDAITKNSIITDLYKDTKGYDIRIFDTPGALHDAIKNKAGKKESELSRMIASFDWPYVKKAWPDLPQKYWEVQIPKDNPTWTLPWNKELLKYAKAHKCDLTCHNSLMGLKGRQIKRLASLDWAEMPHTIDEVGSIFTIQGFDLTYAAVIIGPSVEFDESKQKIRFNIHEKWYNKMKGKRKMADGVSYEIGDVLIKNELRVLLTRGTKGLYIYACNEALRDALKRAVKY